MIGLTRDLAGLLSPKGVCVNAISRGGFARNQPEQFIRDYGDCTPLGRMGRDGIDLNGVILFLASPASDYVLARRENRTHRPSAGAARGESSYRSDGAV